MPSRATRSMRLAPSTSCPAATGSVADVGKGTLARFAAARLRQQAAPPHPVAETSPLGAEVRVSLLHLGGRASSLGPGIWLFRDFLATGHRDLLRFVEELDALTLGPLTAHLRATGAFLLFTTDAAPLP